MTTAWVGYLNAIIPANLKTLGDRVGVIMDPDPNATEAFPTALRPAGGGNVSHYFTAVPLKATGIAILDSFMAGGYPQVFLDAGITTQELDTLRAAMLAEYGDRATYEGHGPVFIAANNLEILPES